MFDLISLIETIGYAGVFAVVFAESGILLGFFLPGDSLLFTAGLLASSGFFNIFLLMPLLFIGAVAGDSFGYYLGRKFGPGIFNRKESFFFHPNNAETSKRFFDKYGTKTIFLARFIPIIRTFAPVLAGVGKMAYGRFLSYNIDWGGGLGRNPAPYWILSRPERSRHRLLCPAYRRNHHYRLLYSCVIGN